MSSAYIHAALLLHFAKRPIDEENLRKILNAAGIQTDESRIKALTAAISEVNIDEAIKSTSIGFTPTTQPVAPVEKPKPEEEKKKEKEVKKKEEEEALAGLGALFG